MGDHHWGCLLKDKPNLKPWPFHFREGFTVFQAFQLLKETKVPFTLPLSEVTMRVCKFKHDHNLVYKDP